jgi:hypothetical protein
MSDQQESDKRKSIEIRINGNPADITLESEKTVGELLSGLEEWLSASGNRITGIELDGVTIDSEGVSRAFTQELAGICRVDIRVSGWPDIAREALFTIKEYLKLYAEASFDEQRGIRDAWRESLSAKFLAGQMPDMLDLIDKTFAGAGVSIPEMDRLIDERIRECTAPEQEAHNIDALVRDIAKRLEDLPLDIQTGRDSRASETMGLFSSLMEKLFRLLNLLNLRGISLEAVSIESLSFHDFLREFSATLQELSSAYDSHDTVLVGDLAEYEISPRLLKLYRAMMDVMNGC